MVYHSHIHEYGYAKWTYNVHIYIYIYITQNIGKHVTTSRFRYETFYYLWVKGFDIRKRDTHSVYSVFSSAPPPHTHTCGTRHKGLREQAKTNRLPPRQVSSQLYWLFQNLPKSLARFRCMTSFALSSPRFTSRAIVTFLSDTSAPPACAWTPVLMLHLSNPCTEPKGSQPN